MPLHCWAIDQRSLPYCAKCGQVAIRNELPFGGCPGPPPPIHVQLYEKAAQVREPVGYLGSFPVVLSGIIGDLITRQKRWKRRGIGRLPKVRTRVVGRKPAWYLLDGRTIITNPEGLRILKAAPAGR